MANFKRNIEDKSMKELQVMRKWVHPGEEWNHEEGGELDGSVFVQVWSLGTLLLELQQETSEGRERQGVEGGDGAGHWGRKSKRRRS